LETFTAGPARTRQRCAESKTGQSKPFAQQRCMLAILVSQQADAILSQECLECQHQRCHVPFFVDQIRCQNQRELQGGRLPPVDRQEMKGAETVATGVVGGETQSSGIIIAESYL